MRKIDDSHVGPESVSHVGPESVRKMNVSYQHAKLKKLTGSFKGKLFLCLVCYMNSLIV